MLKKASLTGSVPINTTVMYFLFDISLDLTWQDFAALWAETERQYAPVTSIDHFLCRSLGDSYLAFYNSKLGHRRR